MVDLTRGSEREPRDAVEPGFILWAENASTARGQKAATTKHRGLDHLRLFASKGGVREDAPDHEPGRRAGQHLRSRRPRWSISTRQHGGRLLGFGREAAPARCPDLLALGAGRSTARSVFANGTEAGRAPVGLRCGAPILPRHRLAERPSGKYLRTLRARTSRSSWSTHQRPTRTSPWPCFDPSDAICLITVLDVVGSNTSRRRSDTPAHDRCATRTVPESSS